jgi:hypothetical protein
MAAEPTPTPDADWHERFVALRRVHLLAALERIPDPERRAEVARLELARLQVEVRRVRGDAAAELVATHGLVGAARRLRNRWGSPMTPQAVHQLRQFATTREAPDAD